MPEGCYLDSSFLLKAYVQETNSADVVRYLQYETGPLLISLLTDVEVVSSHFRKLQPAEARMLLAAYRSNRASGAFQVVPLTEGVYGLAQSLAERYSGKILLRSLDLLHLATALEHGAASLATYDEKLRSASEASGLAVVGARP